MVANLIHDIDRVTAVGINGLIEGNRLHDRFHGEHHSLLGQVQLLCNFFNGGVALQFIYKALLGLHGVVSRVAHGAAYAHGIVIAQIAADFPDNHGDGIGTEAYALLHIEIVDGLDQADAAHLKQVVEILAAVDKALDNAQHQTQVSADELVARLHIALFDAAQKLHLFRFL